MAGLVLVNNSLLSFSGGVLTLTPYAARGLQQTLELITDVGQQVRRDINGVLTDLTATQFRKYRSVISCRDNEAPALDGVWRGQTVTVECAVELSTGGGAPQRPAVSGSARFENGITFYRPVLNMMITRISTHFAEWQAENSWSISLDEV